MSSPPIATSASSCSKPLRTLSTPPSSLYGLVREVPTIVPPRGWELALCYGDARGEAMNLLDAALRENPRDFRALKARAVLRHQRNLAAP